MVEDAHVNLKGVLEYFDRFTQPGDYICVEDTNPIVPGVVGQGLIKELGYVAFGPQKLNELKSFLIGRSQRYLVNQRYTDFFGLVWPFWVIMYFACLFVFHSPFSVNSHHVVDTD